MVSQLLFSRDHARLLSLARSLDSKVGLARSLVLEKNLETLRDPTLDFFTMIYEWTIAGQARHSTPLSFSCSKRKKVGTIHMTLEYVVYPHEKVCYVFGTLIDVILSQVLPT